MSDDALMVAFQFTADDLSYNRRGQMSPDQVAALGRASRTRRITLIVAGLASVGIGIGLLWPFIRAMSLEAANLGQMVCGLPLVLLGLLLFSGLSGKLDDTIHQVEGRVQFVTRESTTMVDDQVIADTGRYILVGEKEFPASPQKMAAMIQGDVYRVYHAESAALGILSVEHVGPA